MSGPQEGAILHEVSQWTDEEFEQALGFKRDPVLEVILYAEEAEDPGKAQIETVCPHAGCTGNSFYEVDRAERWNRIELDATVDDVADFFVVQADGDYQTEFFKCQSCGGEVLLPDWIDTQWS